MRLVKKREYFGLDSLPQAEFIRQVILFPAEFSRHFFLGRIFCFDVKFVQDGQGSLKREREPLTNEKMSLEDFIWKARQKNHWKSQERFQGGFFTFGPPFLSQNWGKSNFWKFALIEVLVFCNQWIQRVSLCRTILWTLFYGILCSTAAIALKMCIKVYETFFAHCVPSVKQFSLSSRRLWRQQNRCQSEEVLPRCLLVLLSSLKSRKEWKEITKAASTVDL